MKRILSNSLRSLAPAGVMSLALALACPALAVAQVKVIISGGFSPPYHSVLPEFERSTGIKVTTGSGASQGKGPETIGAQLRRGVPTDVVIMSKEGLGDLMKQGKIIAGTNVDLAQVLVGVAVRAGAPKPDISTAAAFKKTLLNANFIALPGSTSGIYLTTDLFPRLGIPSNNVKLTARGTHATALVAAGKAELAVQPVSELLGKAGIECLGTIPSEFQFLSVFSAAIVTGSSEIDSSKNLIAFLASEKTYAAIKSAGMEPATPR
jgi:molybdate transport system substrate-binding protein